MQIFTSKTRDYAVIDVETTEIRDGELPRTLFWGYADERDYERFSSTKKLVKFLEKSSPKCLLHHSDFDILQLLVDGFYDLRILKSHHGSVIQASLGVHTMQNTLKVFPVKLAKIFDAFGYKKTSLKYLDKRNYEDCVHGLDCFLQLNELFYNLIGVAPLSVGTVAGTSFRAAELRAGRMPKNLNLLGSFRGGRVDVFNTSVQTAHKFDIHSSYPASLLEVPERDELWHVAVQSDDWIGPLFDSRVEDLLLFPNGCFRSWLYKSTWERYIEPYADDTRIKILSRHKINLGWLVKLRDLIQRIYDLKSSSPNAALVLCCKFLLNAFYGRIGLRGVSERVRILDHRIDGPQVDCYKIRNKWLCFEEVHRDTRSNYPFAAFVTDNARGRLYEAFKRNTPLYGDTDSAFVANSRFKGQQGKACGQWEFLGKGMFHARNVKDYEFDGEETLKGGHGKTIWTFKRFAKGLSPINVVRTRKTPLRKRIVLPDGKTEPLQVNY